MDEILPSQRVEGIKVLSIVPYRIFPARVGGQKGIALFNQYLARVIDLVCLSVRSNEPHYAAGYVFLNRLSGSPSRYVNPLQYLRVRSLVRKYNITHLLLEHPYFGWLGIIAKKTMGIKLIVHSHNIESLRWKSLGKWWWRILRLYEKFTHAKADYNFFIHDEDRKYAIDSFRLDPSRCITITYGIEIEKAPDRADKEECRRRLKSRHNIAEHEVIYLFNGALDYRPNLDAVHRIIDDINPIMLSMGRKYKIIICGRGLPASMQELKAYSDKNIIYGGFVEDITEYFKGADVFINPVVDGGGIKTKLVEALGYNSKAVSTQNGSIGVSTEDTGSLLYIVADHDWQDFAAKMAEAAQQKHHQIPEKFYQKFFWAHIAARAARFIQR